MAEGRRESEMVETLSSHVFDKLNEGGVRQSSFTLIQTALGAGFLTLSYGVHLAGIGLAALLLVIDGVVVYLGMEIMLRGALELKAEDTATLLSKCVGEWSRTALDLLLVCFGNGCCIAFFILQGDVIPGILGDIGAMGWIEPILLSQAELRSRCIVGTFMCVIPLCIPQKLGALRYASSVAIVAVFSTAAVILWKCSSLFRAHVGQPAYGGVEWFKLDANFFKVYGIFLYAYNCHLNLVPVASELQKTSTRSIRKICAGVVTLLVIFYGLIAGGGYLSFLGATRSNVLTNFGLSPAITTCRFMLCVSLSVAIPTTLTPTICSLRCFLKAIFPPKSAGAKGQFLLGDETPSAASAGQSKVAVLGLKALCLCFQVSMALSVSSIADVMGFLGASIGTVLMMVIPLAVLFKVRFDDFSRAKFCFSVLLLGGTTVLSIAAMFVMVLQKSGYFPE